jgi:hypothetical protein
MKPFTMLVAVALAGSVVLSGCGKKEEAPPPVPAPADVKPAATTTAPAPPAAVETAPTNTVDLLASTKSGVAQAMASANAGKYQEALALLQQKATEVQANPEAMKLINDAMAQVKQMMADAATKAAADKVGGALGELGK